MESLSLGLFICLARAALAVWPAGGEHGDANLGKGGAASLSELEWPTSVCAEMVGRSGGWHVAPGFSSPATMLEIQFIEFTVKVLWGFPGSFSLWKLLC